MSNHKHTHDHEAAPKHKCQHGHGHAHNHSHGGHSHGFGHHHHAIDNIRFAFFLNLAFSLIELVGGILIGSMAITADAIHDFGDSVSLGTAWFLEGFANRRSDTRFNFGYRRFSLLSALISGVVITAGSVVIIWKSIDRMQTATVPPASLPMMGLAIAGLLVNGAAAFRLSRGQTQNEKILTWHLLEDVLGWSVVLAGAIAIYFTGVTWLDPLLAVALSLFVSFNVLRHLKDTIYLFLQGRPASFSEAEFMREVHDVPGIEHVDHLAVWSLDGERSILSARLHLHAVHDPLEIERVKTLVRSLAAKQGALQATLETCLSEQAAHDDESSLGGS